MNGKHKCKVDKTLKKEATKVLKDLGKKDYCLNEIFVIVIMLKNIIERELIMNDFTANLEKSFKEFGMKFDQNTSAG